MTKLLKKAFAEASKLVGDKQDALTTLADEALLERHAGRTQKLDPQKL